KFQRASPLPPRRRTGRGGQECGPTMMDACLSKGSPSPSPSPPPTKGEGFTRQLARLRSARPPSLLLLAVIASVSVSPRLCAMSPIASHVEFEKIEAAGISGEGVILDWKSEDEDHLTLRAVARAVSLSPEVKLGRVELTCSLLEWD